MFRYLMALFSGVLLLIVGFMFSLLALAVIAVLGLAAWAYLWWQTRKLRRAMKQQAQDSRVIEGEAVVVDEQRQERTDVLPR